MSEYISRDAALTVLDWDCASQDALDAIKAIPAADVVEVVRCKDCVHRDPEDHKCDCGGQERQGCPLPVRGSYFCAHGKRKDGGPEEAPAGTYDLLYEEGGAGTT